MTWKSTEILSREEINLIHETSLKVLEETGVLFKNRQALGILSEAGTIVKEEVAYIPRDIVEKCLLRAPTEVGLYSTDGSVKYEVGGDAIIYNPGSTASLYLDLDDTCPRKPLCRDMEVFARLVDGLPYVEAQSTALVVKDVPEDIRAAARLYIVLTNSKKPIITGVFAARDLDFMKRMLEAAAGDPERKPVAIFDNCPTSPLQWNFSTSQNIIDCAEAGIAVEILPMGMPGVCSPPTLAGTLVQHHAEALSGIVLAQATKPGTEVLYGGSPSTPTQSPLMSAPETVLIILAYTQIGKHFNLPTHAYLGVSDSRRVDEQAIVESTFSLLKGAEAKINVISGPGMLGSENIQSPEKVVIDNYICGHALGKEEDVIEQVTEILEKHDTYNYLSRIEKGVLVTEETLATDIIGAVGPGGTYSNRKAASFSAKWIGRELLRPKPLRDEKERLNKLTRELRERARKEAKRTIASARSSQDEGAIKTLRKVLKEIKKEHTIGGLARYLKEED